MRARDHRGHFLGVPIPPSKSRSTRQMQEIVSRRVPSSVQRKRVKPERSGRKTLEVEEERRTYVISLVASRVPYPEIAKLVARKYDMSMRGAYHYLGRLNTKAATSLGEFSDEDLMLIFQRIVLSLEDTIFRAKASAEPDLRAAIQGEMALARIFGFDKGTFIAALQDAARQRREKRVEAKDGASPIEDARRLLASDMHDLSVKQLQSMLSEGVVPDLLGEGASGDTKAVRDERRRALREAKADSSSGSEEDS